MKKSKCSEEQIAFALQQADTVTSVEEIVAKWILAKRRFKKYGG